MKEYRVKITVRNNLLLSAIEAAGYKSQTAFANAVGIDFSKLNAIVAMRMAPINDDGEFVPIAKKVMEGLGACPSDLWTDDQLALKLKRNSSDTVMDGVMVRSMLENHVEAMTLPDPSDTLFTKEKNQLVANVLSNLTPREANILKFRFWDEKTLTEIALIEGVTRSRVRQIEKAALRKLGSNRKLMRDVQL